MSFNLNIQHLVKNLQAIGAQLPKEIKKAQKNMTQEDAKVIDEAIKGFGLHEKLKEFNNMPSQMEAFMKKHYGR